jgi:hypothetical protein
MGQKIGQKMHWPYIDQNKSIAPHTNLVIVIELL